MAVDHTESSLVFDFLDHLRQANETHQQLQPLEKNLLRILEVSLPLRKLVCFKQFQETGIFLRYQNGFEPSEIAFIKETLQNEDLDRYSDRLDPWEKSGMKNAGLLCLNFDKFRYIIVALSQHSISASKHEVVKSIADALRQVILSNGSSDPLRNQFNEQVLHNIISGIVVIDHQENIIFLNRAAQVILGYRFDELKNRHCSVIFRELEADNNWLSFTLTTGCLSSRKKIYMVRKDGFEIAVGGTTSLLRNEDGDIRGVIGIFREFDEFEKTQAKRKDLNKISTLSKLSASIAHEIRNPLAGISATAQVLAGKLEDGDRKKKFVTVILEEIDRINRIIKELLSFASPTKSSFLQSNLNKIVEDGLSLVHKKIQKQNIDVVRDYDRELPDILCDQNQIKQAVINILLNSINAMPDGGLLGISTELAIKDQVQQVNIIIHDSGPGFPQSVLDDLFAPFTTTKTYGLGLGLTITKNIIKTHHGSIKAYNLPDKGACVILSIPVNDTEITYDEQPYLPFEDM